MSLPLHWVKSSGKALHGTKLLTRLGVEKRSMSFSSDNLWSIGGGWWLEYAILGQATFPHGFILRPWDLLGGPAFLRAFGFSGMFPAEGAALAMSRVVELKHFYGVSDGLWRAFVAEAGCASGRGSSCFLGSGHARRPPTFDPSGPGGVDLETGK